MTTPKKAAINCGRNTLLKMMVSGNGGPITGIMNASTVPSAVPFPSNAWTNREFVQGDITRKRA